MTLWQDIKAFRGFIRTMNQMTEDAVSESETAQNEEVVIVTYFVPYTFQYTKYYNGGRMDHGWGNTMIYVTEGVDGWPKVQGATQFIRDSLKDKYPNPQVIISGFFEIDRCLESQLKAKLAQAASPSDL